MLLLYAVRQVVFRIGTSEVREKMLIGRGGMFQLAYAKNATPELTEVQDYTGTLVSEHIVTGNKPESGADTNENSRQSIYSSMKIAPSSTPPRGLGLMVADQDGHVIILSIAPGKIHEFGCALCLISLDYHCWSYACALRSMNVKSHACGRACR